MTFVAWVLNLVIVLSASAEQFAVLGLDDRYDFHNAVMYSSLITLVLWLLIVFCGCVSLGSEHPFCGMLVVALSMLMLAGYFAIVVVMYFYMGRLWDKDPKHTIFVFNPFWNEGVTQPAIDMAKAAGNATSAVVPLGPNALAAMWVYTMSDVVTRFYGFCLMMLPVLIAVGLVLAGVAGLCAKLWS